MQLLKCGHGTLQSAREAARSGRRANVGTVKGLSAQAERAAAPTLSEPIDALKADAH